MKGKRGDMKKKLEGGLSREDRRIRRWNKNCGGRQGSIIIKVKLWVGETVAKWRQT